MPLPHTVGEAGDEWVGQGIPGNNRDAEGVLSLHGCDPSTKKVCRPPDGQTHSETNHFDDGDRQDITLNWVGMGVCVCVCVYVCVWAFTPRAVESYNRCVEKH